MAVPERYRGLFVLLAMALFLGGCAAGQVGLQSKDPPPAISQIRTVAEFKQRVLDGDKPVLVDFYIDNCPYCQRLAPVLAKLAEEYRGRVDFVAVNGEESPYLEAQHSVRGHPTVLVFNKGTMIAQPVLGYFPADKYRTILDAVLARHGS